MILFEKARELGELIRTTEESLTKEEAMSAYLNDKEAQNKMKEYEDYQRGIQKKMERDDFSQADFNEASSKLGQMGTELKKHPVVGPYIEAVNKYNQMLNQVFGIIQNTASGTDGSMGCGCSQGSCSDCECDSADCSDASCCGTE